MPECSILTSDQHDREKILMRITRRAMRSMTYYCCHVLVF